MSDLYLETLDCLSVKQLRSRLVHYGMPATGKKEVLKQRLLELFERQQMRMSEEARHLGQETRLASQPSLRSTGEHSKEQPSIHSTRPKQNDKRSERAERKAELQRLLQEMESSTDEDSDDLYDGVLRSPANQLMSVT